MKKTVSYKDLIVWQKGMDLVVAVYRLTEGFPKEEIYSLTAQMRRAAVSIPSNIAEGRRRRTKKDYAYFLRIAYGSGAELETQLELSKRLCMIDTDGFESINNLLIEVMKILNKLLSTLES